MAQSSEGKHPPQNIPWYIGKFNMNYIILRHVEIFPKRFFSNFKKKKENKGFNGRLGNISFVKT
jgi:hypothetical protein